MSIEITFMDKNILKRIIWTRTLCGLNQLELAKMVGFSGAAAISKLENNQRKISVNITQKIADAIGIDFDWLMTGTVNMNACRHIRDSLFGNRPEDKTKFALKIGITYDFLHAIEGGQVSPSTAMYEKIMRALGMEPDEQYKEKMDKAVEKGLEMRAKAERNMGAGNYDDCAVNDIIDRLMNRIDDIYNKYEKVLKENAQLKAKISVLEDKQ